ncbi:cytidine deaminase [Acidisoma cellulosilytica]|uniref:Cytidine deaminase n=1 Tax=Acidisoma cellulosilyticum TaxID=2802395 RepID=A0A964E2W9_9PROT|nr:cytidine deaminase [Acidisoma cellulosilyticum]MCB8879662.1 cytidine deaminase [Acidisoma cellulosilyticum]
MSALSPRLAAAIGPDHVLPAARIPALLAETGLADTDALMLALLPLAQNLARPPISNFRVGAVGLTAETGDVIFGANVEFPGAGSGDTIHAEQFLFTRAYHRGVTLTRIAVSARPCGHCRQFMNEFSGNESLLILDPGGDRQSLSELLPFRFGPADLGEAPAGPGRGQTVVITEDEGTEADPDMLKALIAGGARAHTPYSGCPSALVLKLADGQIITGSAIENAAYNPGMPPAQAALINLIAGGWDYDQIDAAILGAVPGAGFDHFAGTAKLLSIIAPNALLETLPWRVAQSS